MLHFIQRPETDPYYNLAAEEYIFEKAVADTFMTWQNEPSVIIGKHQNALKEINSSFLEENNIPVIRRISGGGTVYHDSGNINFSFIFTGRKDNLIDFMQFTRPIILFLKSLGLDARFEGKNNITVNGLKVSGNSAHLHKNKVLYHGTLLFDTDLGLLEKAIAGNESLFHDKAVSSARAKIINIKEILKDNLTTDAFISQFRNFIYSYFGGITEDLLNQQDNLAIKKLAVEKYMTFQWNFGYSPDYDYYKEFVLEEKEFSVSIKVREGIITLVEFSGLSDMNREQISHLLVGNYHDKKVITNLFKNIQLDDKDYIFIQRIIEQLF